MPASSALWAGVFFTLAPYHLNQFYQASMLAELAGSSVLPFAFCFVERLCQKRTPKNLAGLAISYALLILTHLPLAVIGSLALLIYALVRLPKQDRWSIVCALLAATLLGAAASACYWVTVIAEQTWIRADNILPDPSVDYRGNFVLSTFSPDNLNVWWMNILLLATVAMCWPALARFWSSDEATPPGKKVRERARGLRATGTVLLLTIFMATPLSRPIWDLLRPLQQTQFPWRWLALTSLAGPLLLAGAIPSWKRFAEGNKRPLVILAAGAVAVSIAFSLSHTVREAKWLTAPQFEEILSEIPGSPSVSQWLPSWVNEPIQKMSTPVEAGNRDLVVTSWEPERRTFHLGPGQVTEARVRTFFYPHWQAVSEGRSLRVRPDKDGAMLIAVPENSVSVTLEFREPARVRFAVAVSALAWILIGALMVRRARPVATSRVAGELR